MSCLRVRRRRAARVGSSAASSASARPRLRASLRRSSRRWPRIEDRDRIMSAASRSVHEDLDTPVRRIAQVLARFEANRRGLLGWIDRSWLPAWAVCLESGPCADDGSAALARALGVDVLDLDACRDSDAGLGVLATLA